MRGGDGQTGELFSYVDLEARVRRDHPLRRIRAIVNEALAALEREFAALYSPIGRPSIPPEKLLRAMLLQAFYSIRSERLLMERLEYDLLFRWFVGIGVDDAAWDHSVFSKNRDRLLEGDIAAKFLAAVLAQPKVKKLLSTDHFSVDGTLIEAWASMKSTITIGADNHGEIAFGALQAGLDLGYGPSMVFFTWAGFDEMDEVTGDGSAELLDDGSIDITFAYRNGDEAILKAKRDPS
ncbi:transposase, partial [Mesorhizobium sp. M0751]|uniref:transposase n=1 Tax=Mesorhizobium sp. M0751 TaxID=2956992 RepID=UPI003336A2DF